MSAGFREQWSLWSGSSLDQLKTLFNALKALLKAVQASVDAPPEPATLPPWADWPMNTSVAALLGLIGWGVYELLLR